MESQEDRLAVKVPDTGCFATKPELARQMLEHALQAGIPFKWFTADEVYGNNRALRVWLGQQQIWHVVSLAFHQYVRLPTMRQTTVQQLAATAKADD